MLLNRISSLSYNKRSFNLSLIYPTRTNVREHDTYLPIKRDFWRLALRISCCLTHLSIGFNTSCFRHAARFCRSTYLIPVVPAYLLLPISHRLLSYHCRSFSLSGTFFLSGCVPLIPAPSYASVGGYEAGVGIGAALCRHPYARAAESGTAWPAWAGEQ
ncbi:hypothetical protein BC827DRAFT_70401 [Russula dissimulans]|nr:hypothetical protein BC827DRAFT_70401 [Russula dissimulans]